MEQYYVGLDVHSRERTFVYRTLSRLRASPLLALCCLAVLIGSAPVRAADFGPGFKTQSVAVDGATVSVTVGGSGPPVVLLHGYAETSRMWKALAKVLAPRYTVIAPDLPGIGDSSIPKAGLDMKISAERVHAAVRSLGYTKVRVVGHDIGLMVAYAYAAMYPQEVEKLALMDAFLPGVGGWEAVYNNPGIWHFRFYGATPEALVKGRERIYFEHFWNDFAADRTRSIPEADRRAYTQAYARPGRMAAGFAYFASFPKTAVDFGDLARTRLAIPVLSIGGDKSLGEALGAQTKLVASDVTVVVLKDTGHWILEERPGETSNALASFLQ
ncbi:MAG: alpha/beta hydrolase [Deltaproteobacteria bacterium]|nr:MAG: alpha/beta hydrolase [Deltaproteobacteria bacterium]